MRVKCNPAVFPCFNQDDFRSDAGLFVFDHAEVLALAGADNPHVRCVTLDKGNEFSAHAGLDILEFRRDVGLL